MVVVVLVVAGSPRSTTLGRWTLLHLAAETATTTRESLPAESQISSSPHRCGYYRCRRGRRSHRVQSAVGGSRSLGRGRGRDHVRLRLRLRLRRRAHQSRDCGKARAATVTVRGSCWPLPRPAFQRGRAARRRLSANMSTPEPRRAAVGEQCKPPSAIELEVTVTVTEGNSRSGLFDSLPLPVTCSLFPRDQSTAPYRYSLKAPPARSSAPNGAFWTRTRGICGVRPALSSGGTTSSTRGRRVAGGGQTNHTLGSVHRPARAEPV